jgi:hypothetical protein
MRLLLDECVPRPLKRDLPEHDVHHVVDMGWSSKRNGELLQLMTEAQFEGLLTVDRNIEYQQNIGSSRIGVVIVTARRNRLKELRPLIPQIRAALADLKAGKVAKVGN